MGIQLKEVKTKMDRKTFVYLPEKIHKDHKNWLHPLYMDELTFFNPDKNPQFKENKTILLLAYKNGTPVGRIMGIIPNEFNRLNNVSTARFSYMECREDREVFDALLSAIEDWAKENGCNELIGPMGFSDKEPQGFVTYGFQEETMMVTQCSFEFMKDFIQSNGYKSFVELVEYEANLSKRILERYEPFTQRVERNLDVNVLQFTRTKDIIPYVRGVFDLINTTYSDIYGFTKVTQEEADDFAKRFIPLLNPKLVVIITDENDKVIAFVVAMPDLSKGIRKAKGRLLPFGWFHIFRAMKTSKRLVLLLGAVQNEMQNKGLDAVMAVRLFKSALDLGLTKVDSHLIMKDNVKMRREIERLQDYRLYKEYTIFRKEIL